MVFEMESVGHALVLVRPGQGADCTSTCCVPLRFRALANIDSTQHFRLGGQIRRAVCVQGTRWRTLDKFVMTVGSLAPPDLLVP